MTLTVLAVEGIELDVGEAIAAALALGTGVIIGIDEENRQDIDPESFLEAFKPIFRKFRLIYIR